MPLNLMPRVSVAGEFIVQWVPVLLQLHFSKDSMARAGARNAKALAWNSGNLNRNKRQFTFNNLVLSNNSNN